LKNGAKLSNARAQVGRAASESEQLVTSVEKWRPGTGLETTSVRNL